jgi:hypothetical protein
MISDPLGLMDLEFVCPECGGNYFGTCRDKNGNETGHCHTYKSDGTSCNFVWSRPSGDALVFKKRKAL